MAIDRESWEKLQNDVEMIKTRVSSLDRIAVLQNSEIIIRDLVELVGRSKQKAMVLHLTKEQLSRQELANRLGVDERNLNKLTDPFTGNKGYLNEFRRGGRVYYRRDEKIDLVDFDHISPFKELIESWKAEQGT